MSKFTLSTWVLFFKEQIQLVFFQIFTLSTSYEVLVLKPVYLKQATMSPVQGKGDTLLKVFWKRYWIEIC